MEIQISHVFRTESLVNYFLEKFQDYNITKGFIKLCGNSITVSISALKAVSVKAHTDLNNTHLKSINSQKININFCEIAKLNFAVNTVLNIKFKNAFYEIKNLKFQFFQTINLYKLFFYQTFESNQRLYLDSGNYLLKRFKFR